MAKISRYATVRLATTINANYQNENRLKEGFFLDGRLPGRREQEHADVTTEREDQGFFYALYGTQQAHWDQGDSALVSMQNMLDSVKRGTQDIGVEINDLADCAVAVTGPASLLRSNKRHPYFAGILVKDVEVCAVTTGKGVALLYRDDALYPLTDSAEGLQAVNYSGQQLSNFTDYIAGAAGTIKYSNIAQFKENDCLILTNSDLLDAVGQDEVLHLLHEAQDQAEAADWIVEAATEQNPELNFQVLIASVRQIIPAQKTGRLGLTSAFKTIDDEQKTTLYKPLNEQNLQEAKASLAKEDKVSHEQAERHIGSVTEPDKDFDPDKEIEELPAGVSLLEKQADEQKHEVLGATEHADSAYEADKVSDTVQDNEPNEDETVKDDFNKQEHVEDNYEYYDDDFDFESADYDAFEAGQAYVASRDAQQGAHHADHDEYEHVEYTDYDGYDEEYDDYEPKTFTGDEFDGEYNPYGEPEQNKGEQVKRYVIYAVLILICLACVFALYKMLTSGKAEQQQPTTVANTTLPYIVPQKPTLAPTTTKAPTSKPTTAKATTTKAPEQQNNAQQNPAPNQDNQNTPAVEQPANNAESVGQNVTVNEDTYLYDVAIQYYNVVDDSTIQRIKDANGMSDNVVPAGETIYLP